MNFQMDELLKQDPYAFDAKEKRVGGHFYTALIEELCYHYDQNPLYRKFSQNKGFNPHKFSGEISEIPPVQVSVFKELGKHLSSVPSKDIRFTLQSSATSGIPRVGFQISHLIANPSIHTAWALLKRYVPDFSQSCLFP